MLGYLSTTIGLLVYGNWLPFALCAFTLYLQSIQTLLLLSQSSHVSWNLIRISINLGLNSFTSSMSISALSSATLDNGMIMNISIGF